VPRTPLHQRLISIVEPVCQAAGYELVDLRFLLEQGGWTLRVAVDLPLDEHTDPQEVPSDRVDLEDCEKVSRELSAVLDVEDPIPQAFSLEVSSPGIDRPLRTAAHFQHFAGSEARIQLAMPVRMEPPGSPGSADAAAGSSVERRNFKGILQGVVDGKVAIECDGTSFQLPIDDIESAKLVPDWDAVMKGKSGVGNPLPKPIKPGHRPSQKRRGGHGDARRGQPSEAESSAQANAPRASSAGNPTRASSAGNPTRASSAENAIRTSGAGNPTRASGAANATHASGAANATHASGAANATRASSAGNDGGQSAQVAEPGQADHVGQAGQPGQAPQHAGPSTRERRLGSAASDAENKEQG
jgi:ribosome maturation factor RimP